MLLTLGSSQSEAGFTVWPEDKEARRRADYDDAHKGSDGRYI